MTTNKNEIQAKWWQWENKAIRCQLCPRQCLVRPGKRGFCYVREAKDQGFFLTTYGRSSGFCIDPIEKKPLNHFLPGSPTLTFGTAGCNLGCRFCQNWDISKARDTDILAEEASPAEIVNAAVKHNCQSISFSYNDPVIFAEYALDVAKECQKTEIQTVAVSAGYIEKEPREEFFNKMNATNIDLKGFSESFYKSFCLGKLEPVLETLKYIYHHTKCWLEITTLVIPTANDDVKEMQNLTEWIGSELSSEVPLHLTAFHPDFKMTSNQHTSEKALKDFRKLCLDIGLKFVYTGNIHDQEGSSTYCPKCQTRLISRDWFHVSDYQIVNSCCSNCGEKIPGRFKSESGDWGRKRQSISFK